jgi:hypothetical protein
LSERIAVGKFSDAAGMKECKRASKELGKRNRATKSSGPKKPDKGITRTTKLSEYTKK